MNSVIRRNTLFFLLLLVTGIWAINDTIRIGLGEWAPYLSENKEHKGIVSCIIRDIFEEAGYTVEFVFYPWARAYEEAKVGRLDGTAVWLKTDEREDDFYFSDPLLEETHVFFHLKSYSFEWNSLKDLYDENIGGIIKFSYGKEVDDAIKEGKLNLFRVTTDKQAFNMLLSGRIGIYPQEVNIGYAFIREHFSREECKLITHNPTILFHNFSYLLLSRNLNRNKKLMRIFNRGLRKMKESGRYTGYFDKEKLFNIDELHMPTSKND